MSVIRVLLVVALQLVAVQASNDTNTTATAAPTAAPTVAPTAAPTVAAACVSNNVTNCTTAPTAAPTVAPTVAPTKAPTKAPTAAVVASNATATPTVAPTKAPNSTAVVASNATATPTVAPTKAPTAAAASGNSTASPTVAPTVAPTKAPTKAAASGNSTPAPTAAPTAAVVTVVVIETTVVGVDFAQLSSNATLLAGFKSSVASTFATIAKVPTSSVKITLSSGSVKVKAEITPAAGTTAASLSSTMSAQTDIASKMVTSLKALPGLAAVTSGTLSVSAPVFTTKTSGGASNATTTAAIVETSASGAADVKPAMSAMAMVMAAVYAAHVM